MLQDLCKKKIGWDDPISDEDGERWEKWKSQLPSLSRISLGRCIKPLYFGDLKFAELHNFADASQIAYGAVSYLRMVDVEDRIHCTFLIGKSRLAHLKPMTVPRLELSAAVLAVQLDKSVREELDVPITQSTYWSDSTCVLQYIRNQSNRFHTFVANRLSVIHENSAPHQWRHISSELNPADEVSRGLTVEEMCANSKWLNGPQFLTRRDEFWPRDPTLHEPELSDDDPEIKRAQSNSQSSSGHQSGDVLSSLIERHSSWERLKRAVAWLHRFRTWFIERYSRRPLSSKVKSSVNRRVLSVDEMKEAEKEIIKHTQRISFPEVIQALQRIGSLQQLASGNFRAEEPKDGWAYTQTSSVAGRDGNSKSWRTTGKRSNRLRCKASNHSALPRSRDRFNHLAASSENRSYGSRVRFVQPAPPVLGY